MKIRILSLLVITYFMNTYAFAQSNLNAYKYFTVSKKYDFQKKDDQYQLNSLAKFLFNKEGFKSLFDVETKPQELINNACLNLIVKIHNKSNMLTTKLTVELMNCNNEVVYSGDGRSKFKEYKKAYHEALRKAFEPIKNLNYKYNPELVSNMATKKEVINEEPAKIKEDLPTEVEVNESVEVKEPVDAVDAVEVVEAVEVLKAVEVAETVEVVETVEERAVKPSEVDTISKIDNSVSDILYAQITSNGFQLVDSSPKVVYVLQKSSVVDLFILKDKNGIAYKKNGKWLIEYYANNELVFKELNIKF